MNPLQNCTDISAVQASLPAFLARFGTVTQLSVLGASKAGQHQALCFLRLDCAEKERRLISELGVSRCGEDLLIVVNLQTSDASPQFQRAAFGVRA